MSRKIKCLFCKKIFKSASTKGKCPKCEGTALVYFTEGKKRK